MWFNEVNEFGFQRMTQQGPVKTSSKPYPFRTGWALFLLAINFLVAAYYFHIIE